MNRLDVKDLWNLTLRNPFSKDVRITVEGTVEEASDGLIVAGRSGSFLLKGNETKRLDANNVPGGGQYTWSNRKYQEAILRSGNASSGRYTICIYGKDEEGRELGQQCIEHSLEIMSPPTLLSPADGDTIREGEFPMFTWLPPAPSRGTAAYKIRIVEVIGRQSPNEAMLRNPALFEKDDIRMTTFQYPLSARNIGNGKHIVWQISSGEAKSEIWSFVYGRDVSPDLISETTPNERTAAPGTTTPTAVPGLLDLNSKVEFRNDSMGDSTCYKLVITNNYPGKLPEYIPVGFRISVKDDAIKTIIGGVTDKWRRTPAKFPPGTGSVMWSSISGTIPNGETDMGNIVFQNNNAKQITVRYEWLNHKETVLFADSCVINKSCFYYQMTDEPSNYYIELPDNILNIQYVNNYTSGGKVDIRIIDAETQEAVVPKYKKGSDRNKDTTGTQSRNMSGVNRISMDLGDYDLRVGKLYIIVVSAAKSNYYFTYKMKGGHEK
ncbi:MAG: hypothetical protein WBQ23_10360 [Bacteroidota bacterium]